MYLQRRRTQRIKPAYIPKSQKERRRKKTFVFKVSFPTEDGKRNAIYFTLKFDYAELAIRWSNEMRKLINDHYPQQMGSVVFRFLDLNERPRTGSIVHDLEHIDTVDFKIQQILVLPHTIE